MRMKNIPLAAIAASLVLALGTTAQASTPVNSQAVSATKEISQGDTFKVSLEAWPTQYSAGAVKDDSTMFALSLSDSAKHKGWKLIPTGASAGGYMVGTDGTKIRLEMHDKDFYWSQDGHWWKDNSENVDKAPLFVRAGTYVGAGTYTFSGRVEEYLD
ncbi:TPA: MyfA/PsaA family fimbrial adhesin [Yersinia enterocolitica]|nr:fimbrial protein [Yersinia enterocolitica]EKN6106842.1 fimbrial protein [Yersinia enterocolitica]HDL8400494.1 MyfA/PsaA family fimbrial adhesin [Yersinia enterocolitica]HEI6719049.1 MyfA/PsaA family fimbrial adhesin [Yersinia enterocolitica]HEI6783566.1 MyfA/PsaA family fimbrial adhesin [Yersinia enterocolitica]